MEIERLKQEDSKVRSQIAQYRERIENTPAREQAMTLLSRDYQNTNQAYQTLLKKVRRLNKRENLKGARRGSNLKSLILLEFRKNPLNRISPRFFS